MSSTNSSTGSSLGSATLKVTPEVLTQKAEVVKGKISSMQTAFTSMMNTVKNSKTYWVGDAGDAHRKVYEGYESDITEIFKRLGEHVTDLNSMAGVYQEAENTVKEFASSLPTDLIS